MNVFLHFTFAFIGTLLFPSFIADETLLFSNSVFSLCLLAALYLLLHKSSKFRKDMRLQIYTHILGFLFAFMIAAGHSLDSYGCIGWKKLLVCVFFYTHIIAQLLTLLWRFLMDTENQLDTSPRSYIGSCIEKCLGWLCAHPCRIVLLLLLMWMPCFLADFPGGFRYDATNELNQVVDGFNGNFPLLHSAIITQLLPAFYRLTGSYNTGITVYVVCQMFLIAGMYAHMIHTFWNKGIHRTLLFIVLLYCACFPVIQILVVQEVRDVLFSALLTYTVFLFYLMESDRAVFFTTIRNPILLGIIFVLTLHARNNNAGFIMLVLIIGVSLILLLVNRKTQCFRGAVLFSVTSVVGYLLLDALLLCLSQPLTPASAGASLSLMSQPITRAYFYEREEWTEEELEEFGKYMNLEKLGYCPENADLSKSRLSLKHDPLGFLRLWCKIGVEHPKCYLDAILLQTQNMWYPDSVIDGYNQIFKNEGEPYYDTDKCYYSITSSLAPPAKHMNLLPSVLNYYTQIGLYISFERIPVISMLFSIGFQFWMILHCMFYVGYRKRKCLYLPTSILLGYTLLSACVPLVILRYFAALFLAFPMTLIFTFQANRLNRSSLPNVQ